MTLPLLLEDGRKVKSICYVIDQTHEQYRNDLSVDQKARIIAEATGPAGANSEYLFNTYKDLKEMSVTDAEVEDLVKRVCALIGSGYCGIAHVNTEPRCASCGAPKAAADIHWLKKEERQAVLETLQAELVLKQSTHKRKFPAWGWVALIILFSPLLMPLMILALVIEAINCLDVF